MILNTHGSISDIDRKNLHLLEKSRKYQLYMELIQKTTHINTYTYLFVFKVNFVGIPQGQIGKQLIK